MSNLVIPIAAAVLTLISSIFTVVKVWLRRDSERRVTIRSRDDEIVITGISDERAKELVARFLAEQSDGEVPQNDFGTASVELSEGQNGEHGIDRA
jgi:hypothetical protein